MRKIIAMAAFCMSIPTFAFTIIPVNLKICTGEFVTEHKVEKASVTVTKQELAIFVLRSDNSDAAVLEVRDVDGNIYGTGAVRGNKVVYLPQGFALTGTIADYDSKEFDMQWIELQGSNNGESMKITGDLKCEKEVPMEIYPR